MISFKCVFGCYLFNILLYVYINKQTQTIKNNEIMNTLHLYQESYKFYTINTKLNIVTDFIQFKLATQYQYRPTSQILWAELIIDGRVERYKLDKDNVRLIKL